MLSHRELDKMMDDAVARDDYRDERMRRSEISYRKASIQEHRKLIREWLLSKPFDEEKVIEWHDFYWSYFSYTKENYHILYINKPSFGKEIKKLGYVRRHWAEKGDPMNIVYHPLATKEDAIAWHKEFLRKPPDNCYPDDIEAAKSILASLEAMEDGADWKG